jgi:uncharacterized protein
MIFVDSSAWLAISDVRDGNHSRALAFNTRLVSGFSGGLLTSDYVMDETLTLLRKRSGTEIAKKLASGVERSSTLQLIWVTPAHYRAALDLFLNQRHTTWSFTDCTSFVIMRELKVRRAFTFDSDFFQAGFEVEPG